MAAECDATLIMLFLVAEGDWGYVTPESIDQSAIARGQFTDAFEGMMMMMDDDMMMDDEEMMDDDMMMDDEEMMDDDMMEDMVVLEPVFIDGEPEVCGDLREDLTAYMEEVLIAEFTMMDDGM